MHKKIKVAWICHFSNEYIRSQLPLSKSKNYEDFSPWITSTIKEMENYHDLELHIIAPHRGMKRLLFSFSDSNISYYFFKPDVPLIHRMWPTWLPLDGCTGYIKNRIIVRHYIEKIKPDLINLHGAENPHYSSSILGIDNYPIYLCVQGIYSDPVMLEANKKVDNIKVRIERTIHRKEKYFGIRAPYMAKLIEKDNPDAIFLWQPYSLGKPEFKDDLPSKDFDFVYFARITPAKGIEDLIEAISIIKLSKPDVKLNVIGPGSDTYLNTLNQKVSVLGLERNVLFSGTFETLEQVYTQVIRAKVSVLPTKADNIPSTIVESIQLGLPVVSYRTGGIPFLNNDGAAVLLCEKGDIQSLASNMVKVLNDNNLAFKLVTRGRSVLDKYFDSSESASRLFEQYKAIIGHYRHNIPIAEELLFDESTFQAPSF